MATLAREVTQFSLSDGAEVALLGWWWFLPGDWTGPQVASMLDDGFASTYWWDNSTSTDARLMYSGHTALADRYLELYDEDTNEVISRTPLSMPANLSGASPAGQLPVEVAACVSVRSGFSSRSGNGRFYLPAPDVDAIGALGTFTTAFQANIMTSLGSYFDNAHAAEASLRLGTWSKQESAFTPAAYINIGSIPDSQRRRRNKLVEVRDSYVLA